LGVQLGLTTGSASPRPILRKYFGDRPPANTAPSPPSGASRRGWASSRWSAALPG